MKSEIIVNNKKHKIDVEESTPLLWVLRDVLNLVGTKFGCGIGQCGACSIHLDGVVTRSCLLPVSVVGDLKITTIEGLSKSNDHPVQKAWRDIDVPQCGYCQSGQIMTASSLLIQNSKPTKEEIRNAMHGNICRCATYKRIEEAVRRAVVLIEENK